MPTAEPGDAPPDDVEGAHAAASAQASTVTLMFTDIEGSTRLLQELGDDYEVVLTGHHAIMETAIARAGGRVIDTQGDAFFAAFTSARDALDAAIEVQLALAEKSWPRDSRVRVRIGLHTGEPLPVGQSFVGIDVHRAARICSAAHGGQIILSAATRSLLTGSTGKETRFVDLGEHRLKDLEGPEHIFQVVADGLGQTFAPLKSLEVPSNLPSLPTPFVGRTAALREVRAMLRDPDVRLLTLSGPGGTGKTRLAIQAVSGMLDDFKDGIFLVTLAALTDPDLVAPAAARTLHARETPGRSTLENLKHHLAGKQLLLVLDNFENVVGAAPMVGELVSSTPTLTVLVTSRAVLRLSSEQELYVPPLELPHFEHTPSVDELTQYEAVDLFIQRAQSARRTFSVTNENAPAVAEICARLEGLPLAIELAAARIRLLSPQAILKRLESQLDLLTGGASDLPLRQRALRTTIGWSHELLTESEQELFRRLSVFVRSRSLEAIEAVCATDGADPLDALTALVEQSLVQRIEQESGEATYTMLESIREYAVERLDDSGEADEIRLAHARYYADFTERGEAGLKGPDQAQWFDRLEAEHDNVRVALEWLFRRPDDPVALELAYRILAAMAWFWYAHGHVREGAQWLEAALAIDGSIPPELRARALQGLGILADLRGEPERAAACFEESLALFRQLGDDRRVAGSLNSLGIIARGLGDHDRAQSLLEESLSLRRGVGSDAGLANPLANLGIVAMDVGDHARARRYFEESLAIDRANGNDWGVAVNMSNVAVLCLEEGDLELACEHLAEGIELLRDIGDPDALQECLDKAAMIAAARGDAARALRLAAAAVSAREQLGGSVPESDQLMLDRYLGPAEASLTPDTRDQARAEGSQMLLNQALAYAVEGLTRADV